MANAKRHFSAAALSLVLCALASTTPAFADALSWASLSAEQQATLADFEPRWDELSDSRRAQLIERADRWRSLPDERRQAIQARWNELKAMPPEARQALRQRWNSLTPDERREIMGASVTDGAMATSN